MIELISRYCSKAPHVADRFSNTPRGGFGFLQREFNSRHSSWRIRRSPVTRYQPLRSLSSAARRMRRQLLLVRVSATRVHRGSND
jgi:hypothetical protein